MTSTRDQREWVFEVREVKSENKKLSLFFKKCKVKKKTFTLFREAQSENKMLSLFFEKWKVKSKCFEIEIEKWKFSRILNNSRETRFLNRFIPWKPNKTAETMACRGHFHNLTFLKSESYLTNLLYCRHLILVTFIGNRGSESFFETIFWLRSIRPQYFVATIQRSVSSAKFFLLLLSADRMAGTAHMTNFILN